MSCFEPLQGYRTRSGTIVFDKSKAFHSLAKQTVPCGRCIGCRLERSKQWAIRIMHEASLYPHNNSFITLTYDNVHLPRDRSLDVTHFQRFMKRLRFRFAPKTIRFFHCGEYGEKTFRPHYHAILFNHTFDDKYLWMNNNGHHLFRSHELERLWEFGHSSIGDVTFESAAYVARYIMKKVTGDLAIRHYLDEDTGVVRQPEYTTMSRRPGIGKAWIDKHMHDTYKDDSVIVRNRPMQPPKYYDSQFEIVEPELFKNVKEVRKEMVRIFMPHNTPERLAVRKKVKEASFTKLIRPLE